MTARRHPAVWLLCVMALAGCARGERPDDRIGRLDAIFAQWTGPNSPGCAVGISQNGVTLYERAYGMASLELAVPLTNASVFPAASVSKQFTAMSIALLANDGGLSLDDAVATHVPEWRDRQHHITIRQLVTHTSGIREAFGLVAMAPPTADHDTNDAIAAMLARQQTLNFEPGTQFQYNNSGYNLLGTIIGRVAGRSLRTFADERIFRPLGMKQTHFHDDVDEVVSGRVSGYWRDARGFHPGSEAPGVVGNAGLQTTVGDLLRWAHNLDQPRISTPALVTMLQTPASLSGGGTSPYGFGLALNQYRGLRVVEHAGGDRGIAASLARYPERKLAIAMLCNTDAVDTEQTMHRVADMFLTDLDPATATPHAPPSDQSATLSASVLSESPGLYRTATGQGALRFRAHDGSLFMRDHFGDDTETALTVIGPDRIAVPGGALTFAPSTGERPHEWRVVDDKGQLLGAWRRTTVSVAPSALSELSGHYYSDEIDVTYRVDVRDGTVLVTRPGRGALRLSPMERDVFAGQALGIVTFIRSATGAVTGFETDRALVRHLRFARLRG